MESDDCLNVLEQQLGLHRLYTQICLCYSIPESSSPSPFINKFIAGLSRLSSSFPWLASQVINAGASSGNSGVFKIVPFEKTPSLVVKDYRDDPSIPTMSASREANFPASMLDEGYICPRKTLSMLPGEPEIAPVFLVQANFIKGGLLLTFTGQHNTMDMTGQGEVMSLFAKACRNEPFTKSELSSGNQPRKNLIPILDDSYKPGPELYYQTPKPPPSEPVIPSPPPARATWTYITFSPSSLSSLKELATQTLPATTKYISTDDALSAFLWKSITLSRLPHLPPTTTSSTFARAVSVRSHLNIPSYLGVCQHMTYNTLPLSHLSSSPLGIIASHLRSSLSLSSVSYSVRAFATHQSRELDKGRKDVTATIDSSKDVMLSSWAKVGAYGLDFGEGLRKVEAVRKPSFTEYESLCYFMPRRGDGEVAVMVCLRDEDLEVLRGDQEFIRFGTWVG